MKSEKESEMKREEKERIMDCASNDIDSAKYKMARAADYLASKGMLKDSEQLMKMVYRLEAFENKYNQYSLHNIGG